MDDVQDKLNFLINQKFKQPKRNKKIKEENRRRNKASKNKLATKKEDDAVLENNSSDNLNKQESILNVDAEGNLNERADH